MTSIPSHGLLLLALCACGNDTSSTPSGAPKPAAAAADEAGHHHGERVEMGALTLAGHAFTVYRVAPIEPGKEGDFDLEFAKEPMPEGVRGWVGREDAQGSRKVRFAKETKTRMHGHPEVPSPLPAGSRVWIEVDAAEGAQRSSLPIDGK
jgi:hypothetical protein